MSKVNKMQDLNKIYDVSDFKEEFERFMEENEFGNSVYGLCYEAGLVRDLKECILKLKYSRDPFDEIVLDYIPPSKMIRLRELVKKHTKKFYEEIHKERFGI